MQQAALNDFCQLCSHFVNGMVLTIGKFLGVAALLAATLPVSRNCSPNGSP